MVTSRAGFLVWFWLLLHGVAFAQGPQIIRFDGGSADAAAAVATDAAGAVYVGGSVNASQQAVAFAVVKHDAAGTVRWVARFGGSAATGYVGGEVFALALDAAGNVYAAGRIARRIDPLTLAFDWLVASFDPQGRQRWAHVINGPADGADAAMRLVVDPAGAVYVAGGLSQAPWLGADTRWLVAKYAAGDGTLLWTRTEGGPGPGPQGPVAMALDPAGALLVLGSMRFSADGLSDIALLKFDPAGQRLWQQTHAAAPGSDDVPAGLAVGPDGSAYVAGMVSPFGDPEGEFVPLLLGFDAGGGLQFAVNTPTAGGASVVVAADGHLVVAGTAIGAVGSAVHASVSSFTTSGAQRWTRRLFGNETFAEGELAAAADGSVYYGARIFQPSGFDYLALKFDAATGAERWRDIVAAGNAARDAHLSSQGDFLVTGSSDGTPTDMLTARYPAGFTPPPPAPPAAPSELSLVAGRGSLTLQWRDNAGNETGFKVERALGNAAFVEIATLGADVRSHVDSGLAKRQTYRYRVRAFNDAGPSAYSNIASGRPR